MERVKCQVSFVRSDPAPVWWRDSPEEDEREDAHGAVVPDVEDEQRALPEEQNDGVEELVVLRKRTSIMRRSR